MTRGMIGSNSSLSIFLKLGIVIYATISPVIYAQEGGGGGFSSRQSFVDSCTEFIVNSNPDNLLDTSDFAGYMNELRCGGTDPQPNCDEAWSFHSLPLALQINFALLSDADFSIEFTPPDDMSGVTSLCDVILVYLINLGWIEVTGDLAPSASPSIMISTTPIATSTVPSDLPSNRDKTNAPSITMTESPTYLAFTANPTFLTMTHVPSPYPTSLMLTTKPSFSQDSGVPSSNKPTSSSSSNLPTSLPVIHTSSPISVSSASPSSGENNLLPTLRPTTRSPIAGTSSPVNDSDDSVLDALGIILLGAAGFLLLGAIAGTYFTRSRQKKRLYEEMADENSDIEQQDNQRTLKQSSLNDIADPLGALSQAATSVEPSRILAQSQNDCISVASIPQFVVPSEIYKAENRESSPTSGKKDKSVNTAMEAAIENGDWQAVAFYARKMTQPDNEESWLSNENRSSLSMSFSSTADRTKLSESDQRKAAVLDAYIEVGDWEGLAVTAECFNQHLTLEDTLRLRGIDSSGLNQNQVSSSLSAQQSVMLSSSSSTTSEQFGGVVQLALRKKQMEVVRKRVSDLLEDVAPHEIGNLDAMLEQFEGREDELVATLLLLGEKKRIEHNGPMFYSRRRLSIGSTSSSNIDSHSATTPSLDDEKLPNLAHSDGSFASSVSETDLDGLDAINAAIEVGDWDEVQRHATAMGYESASTRSSKSSLSSGFKSSLTSTSLQSASVDGLKLQETTSRLPATSITRAESASKSDQSLSIKSTPSLLVEQALAAEISSDESSELSEVDQRKMQNIQTFMESEDWDGLVAYTSGRNLNDDDSFNSTDSTPDSVSIV